MRGAWCRGMYQTRQAYVLPSSKRLQGELLLYFIQAITALTKLLIFGFENSWSTYSFAITMVDVIRSNCFLEMSSKCRHVTAQIISHGEVHL
ncbi:unnamed protein product [Cuscuta campestris]|uniref:Uncharacterized protein n=1 Tax=Cuscuta campestris TaxID=132261 RepID=A0A484KJS7_9ASTE|nr:unnamed protein product [Cuscuta campestris]